MKLGTLVNALDTIVDKIEFYHGDWVYDFTINNYYPERFKDRIKKFRVYESEETVILMVLV